jgi:predicted Zn-ribbon and HTH transcriptional regulator
MVAGNKPIRLGSIAQEIVALLREHPEGLSIRQLRELTGHNTVDQEHFNRRLRDVRKLYILTRTVAADGTSIYILGGDRPDPAQDSGAISEKLRAQVLHRAHGRCQMCGRTVTDDHIKLQADHRIPQTWGGATEDSNLWAICEACNRGKRDYFASFDVDEMKEIIALPVHPRIAQLLRRHLGKPVPAYLIEFVANATEQQEDWQKRLRELRYPPIGLQITVTKEKTPRGVKSFYTLKNWQDLPDDYARQIREYEKQKKIDSEN